MTEDGTGHDFGIAISAETVWEAINVVIDALGTETLTDIKVRSGEHLAIVLTTAFLGVPPVAVDSAGGVDIEFDLRGAPWQSLKLLLGREDAQYADFEIKSLPGPLREYNATIDRARHRGVEPRQRGLKTTVVSANDVVDAAREMIAAASEQLRKKSASGRAHNVFLIAHPLEYMFAEFLDTFIAHHLAAPKDLPDNVDTVWLLFAPTHLVVWSAANRRWSNLIFTAMTSPEEELPGAEDGVDYLVAVDGEFHRRVGLQGPSPYAFKLVTEDPDEAPTT